MSTLTSPARPETLALVALPTSATSRHPYHGPDSCGRPDCCWSVDDLGALGQ